MIHPIRFGLAFALLATLAMPSAEAAGVPAGSMNLTGTAIMDLTLSPGPFNPTNDPLVLKGLSGFGTIKLDYAAEDTATNTIQITSLSGGMYYGIYDFPGLGLTSYVFGNILPLTGADFISEITNVTQHPDDSFKSGDFSLGGASFGFEFLSGPVAGLKLFTDPSVPFSFSSTFDGLPPSDGTVLMNSGADSLNVYIYGDPTLTPVAVSSNRMIVLSVPEPSSIVMIGLGSLGLMGAAGLGRLSKVAR